MRSVTKKAEVGSVRNQVDTPDGTGISEEGMTTLLENLRKTLGKVLQDVMEKDNIIPSDIIIQMDIFVKGHDWKAEGSDGT